MPSPLLLKTHRSLVAARLRSLASEAEQLTTTIQDSPNGLPLEHAIEAVEQWAVRVTDMLRASFTDDRVAVDVAEDLHRTIKSAKVVAGVPFSKRSLSVSGRIRDTAKKMERLSQNIRIYDEPRGLPPLQRAEQIEVALDTVRQFNKGASTVVPRSAPASPAPSATPATDSVAGSEPCARAAATTPTARLVFISHSSKDAGLASKLVRLLTMAVKPPLNKADILCTSVAGCTLEGGAQTHDRIRAEVKGAPVFIGLVTSLSTESSYVLFELGARWMAGGRTIPVLGPGEGYDRLPGPWNRNVNALRTDDRAKVLQLVREIAQELGRDVDSPDAWHDEADAVVTHK